MTDNRMNNGLLAGIRVVDVTGAFGTYASRLLCDHGATVVRVVADTGDPTEAIGPHETETGASYFARFANAGKRSVTVPATRLRDAAFIAELLGWCDILIEELPTIASMPDAEVTDTIAGAGADKIVVSIRPFAEGSRMQDFILDDLAAQAVGGLMSLSGDPAREPLALYGGQAHYIVGVFAATAALLGLGDSGGPTGRRHYVVSIQEAIVHSLETAVQYYTTEGVVRTRKGAAQQAGDGSYRSADGRVVLGAMTDLEWGRLCTWLARCRVEGATEFAGWNLEQRRDLTNVRRFTDAFEAFTMGSTSEHLATAGQANQVLISPSYRMTEILSDSQLTYDQYFRSVGDSAGRHWIFPGAPYRISGGLVQVREGARRLGEDNEWFFRDQLGAGSGAVT